MTYPMRDLVIHEGTLYQSHLHDLYEDQWWTPKPPEGDIHVFPVTSTACWHGYLTVFSTKIGEPLRPSWLLTFTPVDKAPHLTYHCSTGDVVIQPQVAPNEIDGTPIPNLGIPSRNPNRPAAYDLSTLNIHPWLWELGLILWKPPYPQGTPDTWTKHLLEIGEANYKVGHVLSFRDL